MKLAMKKKQHLRTGNQWFPSMEWIMMVIFIVIPSHPGIVGALPNPPEPQGGGVWGPFKRQPLLHHSVCLKQPNLHNIRLYT